MSKISLTQPEDLGLSAEQLARIEQHFQSQYIDKGKIVGCSTLVARAGKVCYFKQQGLSDRERNTPMSEDTLFRIYSMSKPITSIALMQLYEQGKFALTDPVHRFIPEFKGLGVYTTGSFPTFMTKPCQNPMTIKDLFMHTSGLTYDFLRSTNIDHAYRKRHIGWAYKDNTLKDMIDELAKLPLEFEPGTAWNYSVSVDVMGYIIEQISGQTLESYLQEHIFTPLGMNDTSFSIPIDKQDRFSSCYLRGADKELILQDDGQESDYRNRVFFSGGGGLISSMGDYLKFCEMLRNRGEYRNVEGELGRMIGSRTLDYMTRNHIPDNQDMVDFGTGTFTEARYEGIGFGLGFATKVDGVKNSTLGSEGTFFWSGAASTLFWIDPEEDLVVIFMSQFMPSATFNFRDQLLSLVYPALTD